MKIMPLTMKIETKPFALAFAEAAGIVYAICAAVVAVSPASAFKLLGWIAHLTNLEELARQVTFSGFLLGFVQVVVYTYLSAWLFAALFNRAARQN